MTTFSETTLPALIFSVPAGHPKGDVPALGRLTINEAQAVDQFWCVWGCETNDYYTHTDSTGSGALFYEAEGRTVQGGAAVASASGVNASPAGSTTNNIVRHTNLPTEYVSLLSTQATGGGAHLSHVGSFRVFVRCRISTLVSTESVSVALEWGVGDFRSFTRNGAQTIPYTDLAQWRLLDLGIVSIPLMIGTQRWEGRVLAKSTVVGTDFDLDCLLFVPVDVASGEASAVTRTVTPTAFVALDTFQQVAGALTAKTSEVGGNWVGAGDADDFNVVANGGTSGTVDYIQRTATADAANTGRWVTLDVNTAGVIVQSDMFWSAATGLRQGLVARYIDTSNWVMGRLTFTSSGSGVSILVEVVKRVAGTITVIGSSTIPTAPSVVAAENPVSMVFLVDSAGRYVCSLGGGALSTATTVTGQDSALATGGALATGDVGAYGENTAGVGIAPSFVNIQAAAYVADAAIYASQSLEIRHDRAIREDSTGAIWQPASSYEGDFLRVPVTGREQRSVRFIVKASRNDPATSSDPAIDDINATLAVTPRYLSVPTPS